MKLEFLEDLTDGGRYPAADPDKLIRLYDFNQLEAVKFRSYMHNTLVHQRLPLDLSTVDFIQPVNCTLIFTISHSDEGAQPDKNQQFLCKLTHATYVQMLEILDPFCKANNSGHTWLYDPVDGIDILFSPGGFW